LVVDGSLKNSELSTTNWVYYTLFTLQKQIITEYSIFIKSENKAKSSMQKNLLVKLIIGISLIQLLIIAGLFYYIKTQKEVLKDLAVLKKTDLIFRPDANLKNFYEPKANTQQENDIKWTGEKVLNTINSDSLNERYDYSPTYNQDEGTKFRIITLGDSFTYGMFVNTADNFPEQLEDQLNQSKPCSKISKYEVINLGVPGYDTEYSVRRYKDRGQKYDPDLVIWFVKRDDFDQITEIIASDAQKITDQLREKGELEGYHARGFYNPGFEIAAHELEQKYGKKMILNHQTEALKSLNLYFQKSLILLTFEDLNSEYKNILVDFAQTRSDTYLFDGLPKLFEDEIFPDTHPNKKGYARISGYLLENLQKNNLLSCF
jgi:lysophospholipase L1-like esterase